MHVVDLDVDVHVEVASNADVHVDAHVVVTHDVTSTPRIVVEVVDLLVSDDHLDDDGLVFVLLVLILVLFVAAERCF